MAQLQLRYLKTLAHHLLITTIVIIRTIPRTHIILMMIMATKTTIVVIALLCFLFMGSLGLQREQPDGCERKVGQITWDILALGLSLPQAGLVAATIPLYLYIYAALSQAYVEQQHPGMHQIFCKQAETAATKTNELRTRSVTRAYQIATQRRAGAVGAMLLAELLVVGTSRQGSLLDCV